MRIKVKAILPRKPLVDVNAFESGLDQALDEAAAEALALYEKTTSTWSTRVNFTIRRTRYGRSVGTRSTIYKYVDAGTRAHPITPRGPYPLRFPMGGRPKSRPNYIASYQGARGNQWVSPMKVSHPGTEPRNFTQKIEERVAKSMKKKVKSLMKEVVAK